MINLFSTFQLGQECNMLESIDKQRIQGYFTEELMKGAGGGGVSTVWNTWNTQVRNLYMELRS